MLGRMPLSFSSKAYRSTRQSSKDIQKDNITNNVSLDHEVSINDTVRSIVDCEILWSEMQETIRASGAVTSLAVNEVCRAYIKDRQEQIRKERREEQKRQESNQNTFSKIAKRLSMFG
jgi:predicted metal-dependent peptidase